MDFSTALGHGYGPVIIVYRAIEQKVRSKDSRSGCYLVQRGRAKETGTSNIMKGENEVNMPWLFDSGVRAVQPSPGKVSVLRFSPDLRI